MKRGAGGQKAPASLRERILARIAGERALSPMPSSETPSWPTWAPVLAAAMLLVASMTILLLRPANRITPRRLAPILIADHRETVPDRMQIVTPDRQALLDWFQQRVDFAFRLPATRAAELIGGRLCHLQGRRAALIAYRHAHQRVSLYVFDGRDVEWPEKRLASIDGRRFLVSAERGYNLILWRDRGLVYGLVGDVPHSDLLQLAMQF
ncbi:MAG: anti-sigma factor [Acidobacteria bacterium]|nr:MAG: anti-sigma factor [Acidobacteriota bacterium]